MNICNASSDSSNIGFGNGKFMGDFCDRVTIDV